MMMQSFASLKPFAESAFGKTISARNPMQTMLKSVGAVSKTAQTAGIEWVDFTKQSIEHGTAAMRKLAKARDPKTALEIQAEFLKGSFARMQAQAKFIGDLYKGLAEDMTKDLAKVVPADAKVAPADAKLPAIA